VKVIKWGWHQAGPRPVELLWDQCTPATSNDRCTTFFVTENIPEKGPV
jgi:hypothetical protein